MKITMQVPEDIVINFGNVIAKRSAIFSRMRWLSTEDLIIKILRASDTYQEGKPTGERP